NWDRKAFMVFSQAICKSHTPSATVKGSCDEPSKAAFSKCLRTVPTNGLAADLPRFAVLRSLLMLRRRFATVATEVRRVSLRFAGIASNGGGVSSQVSGSSFLSTSLGKRTHVVPSSPGSLTTNGRRKVRG